MKKYLGIVEGFYWTPQCEVGGQFGEFEFKKRIDLLRFMGKKELNMYLYDPKILRGSNYERAHSKELVGNPEVWQETFKVSRSAGVDFIWGLAPGSCRDWKSRPITDNIDYILGLGAEGIALLFDDVPGGATEREMKLQAEFASELHARYGTAIKGFCPGTYHGSKSSLEKSLNILDEGMPKEIPLIITGKRVWCPTIAPEDIPRYDGRGIMIWDNWMAADTNNPERLEFHPPTGRPKSLFNNIEGYLLNPCFPVERIVPMVSAISEFVNGGINLYENPDRLNELLEKIGKEWADFLNTEISVMQKLLLRKVGKKKVVITENESKEVVNKWPSLKPFFE